jgi:hypothetical protein
MHSWGTRRPGDTPVTNIIITLSIVHLWYLLMLNAAMSKIFGWNASLNLNRGLLLIGIFAFFGLNYLLLYNREKWAKYVSEFQRESPKQSKRGTIMVLTYLIGSFALFVLTLVLVFGA